MIGAVVFDFDGVILESGDIKTVAFVELFADRPEHGDAIRAHHLENVGISRYKKFKWIYANLFQEPLSDAKSAALGEQFSELVLDKVLESPFVPGALEALEGLHGKLPLYVASGTPETELHHIVAHRNLDRFFEQVHGSPTKKADVLQWVADRHGLASTGVLMVGDGESDHRAALAAKTSFYARRTPDVVSYWNAAGVPGADDLTDFQAFVQAR